MSQADSVFFFDNAFSNQPTPSLKPVIVWLLVCCVLIFCMVILGGVTRLTGSGLSMVEWAPIMGVVPPLSLEQWQASFELYKSFPEYQKIYPDMDLAGYQKIFLMEYAHRMLGRLIGLVFFVPFVIFLFTRHVTGALGLKLLGVFILGGLQGLLGWYMVKSGLVDNPHVSQYRLTAHLMLAVTTYALLIWLTAGLVHKQRTTGAHKKSEQDVGWFLWLPLLLVIVAVVSGGFMAGTRAGHVINTFPTMNGEWLPQDLLAMKPLWLNPFENVVTIQFWHRLMALVTALSVLYAWSRVRRLKSLDTSANWMLVALAFQLLLGISTLLLKVPVAIASAHQAGALVLLTCMLLLMHKSMHPAE